jgi:hypothetical protein
MPPGDNSAAAQVERYWVAAGSSYSLTPVGWLADPGENHFYAPNRDAVTTASLVASRCLVLLGEPGMGKTTALEGHGGLTPSDGKVEVLRVDLGSFPSENRLARRVFENPKITTWLAGTSVLCLTLDSFDEAHNRIENLPRMLAEYLEEWDCGRLLLRIACRTADWPSSLRTALDQQFGQAEVFELLPLRRDDAAMLFAKSRRTAKPRPRQSGPC